MCSFVIIRQPRQSGSRPAKRRNGMYVYYDRYGYITRSASCAEYPSRGEFLRECDNLSSDASLEYASGSTDTVPDDYDIGEHNRLIATQQ